MGIYNYDAKTIEESDEYKNVRFLHIPRTGGRFVHEQLENNKFIRQGIDPTTHIYGKELMHLDHEAEFQYWTSLWRSEGLCWYPPKRQFAIVRNPVDRFNSSRWWLGKLLNDDEWEKLEDYEQFRFFMEECNYWLTETKPGSGCEHTFAFYGFRGLHNNWFAPQNDYLDGHGLIKTWKFEDGLGKDWEEWMVEEIGFKNYKGEPTFVLDETLSYDKAPYDHSEIKLSNKILDNAERYYLQDRQILGY